MKETTAEALYAVCITVSVYFLSWHTFDFIQLCKCSPLSHKLNMFTPSVFQHFSYIMLLLLSQKNDFFAQKQRSFYPDSHESNLKIGKLLGQHHTDSMCSSAGLCTSLRWIRWLWCCYEYSANTVLLWTLQRLKQIYKKSVLTVSSSWQFKSSITFKYTLLLD